MPVTDTKEKGLESLIVKWLVEQNGYEQGTSDNFSREYAVDETRLFRFLSETQGAELDKLGVFQSDLKRRNSLIACAVKLPSAASLMCFVMA